MSYSNQTPYLGLPIRSASDTFNTLDNNDAFELTDTKVKEAVDNAAQATEDASEAKTIANAAKETAEQVAGDIDGIDATLDEHAERLVILSNRQTSQAAAIKTKAASTSIGDLYDPEEGIYAVDDRIVYEGQLYQCVTAVITPEDFDVTKWTPINMVDILPSPGGSIDAEDVSFNDTLAQLGANDVQDAIDALKTLIDNIGGGSMPTLNFGSPLYTFDATHTSFTANKVCYLKGTVATGDNSAVTINGTPIAKGYWSSTVGIGPAYVNEKLSAGDVVVADVGASGWSALSVYEEV